MLGPETYNIPDSFEELSKKPKSTRGVCQTRAQRFVNTGVVSWYMLVVWPYFNT